ncbi:hypothetical protein OK016_26225 [Vibrio chagasii]|nr:hypothetical protein [Vibrio chagasii]
MLDNLPYGLERIVRDRCMLHSPHCLWSVCPNQRLILPISIVQKILALA